MSSIYNYQEKGKSLKVYDEGILLGTNVASLDFTGAGLTASILGYDVTVNGTGGGGGSGSVNTVNSVGPDGSGNVFLDTDDVPEGTGNLYFTSARVQAVGDSRYIRNQNASAQTANFWINGKGVFEGVSTDGNGSALRIVGTGSSYGGLTIDMPQGPYATFMLNGVVKWYFGNPAGGSKFQISSTSFTNSLFTLDSATNYVGIDAVNPAYKLSIGANAKGIDEYNSGGALDALKAVGNNLGATFGVQNLNSSGFSGVEYIGSDGNVKVFSGYYNTTGEFRFNQLVGDIRFMIGGSESFRVESTDGNVYYSSNAIYGNVTDLSFSDARIQVSKSTSSQSSGYKAGAYVYNTATNQSGGSNWANVNFQYVTGTAAGSSSGALSNNLFLQGATYTYTTSNIWAALNNKVTLQSGATADLLVNTFFATEIFNGSSVTSYIANYLETPLLTGGGTIGTYWGVYQEYAAGKNYFAGDVLIGTTTDAGAYKLQVTGDSRFDGSVDVITGGALRVNGYWGMGYSGGDVYIGGSLPGALSIGAGANNQISITNGGIVSIATLATGLTPPTTTGTTKMVITDANGQLSFANIPSGGGGTPGGSNTQLQYNNSGAFGGIPYITYNGTDLQMQSNKAYFYDATDATKRARFITSTIGTGIDRDFTLPNVSGTLVTTGNLTAITTVGTISSGIWNGTAITDSYIASASTWNAKESALTFSTGLTRITNTITNNLLTGFAGGQTIIGGTATGESITISSTSHATKGKIITGTSAYDEATNYQGLGTVAPDARVTIEGTSLNTAGIFQRRFSTDANASTYRVHKARGTKGSETVVVANDLVWRVEGYAYDGAAYDQIALIDFAVDAVTSGQVSGEIRFGTTNSAGTNAYRMIIDSEGRIGMGATPAGSSARLTLGGNISQAARSTNGAFLTINNSSITATDTTATGTVTHANTAAFFGSAFATTNTVTYTNASTLYIAGTPSAGTNVTITNAWALFVNAGNASFGGGIKANSWIQFGTTNNIIYDSNANELLTFTRVTSAVNEINISNNITGAAPIIAVTGGDTDVSMSLQAKGTGAFMLLGTATAQAKLRFYEQTTNGSNYIELAPAAAIGGNVTLTLPEVSATLATLTGTETFTNKRITKRLQSTTSTATLTITSDTVDMAILTAQAAGLTIAAPTGTPTDGQELMIRIKDNATAQTITWNAIWRIVGTILPTTTVVSKTLYVKAVYNAADTKWDVLSVGQEA